MRGREERGERKRERVCVCVCERERGDMNERERGDMIRYERERWEMRRSRDERVGMIGRLR